MIELSMHILDIVENSVVAGANEVSIFIGENEKNDILTIKIWDDGVGMDENMQRKASDPFVTTKVEKRVGLGLSMLSDAARKSGGEMRIGSQPGKGTTVRATFGLSHVDRQPLGDMVETMVVLIVGYPDVEFTYRHDKNGKEFVWSTGEIESSLCRIHRSSPEVIDFIRGEIRKGIERLEI